jgi:hypothetical protein
MKRYGPKLIFRPCPEVAATLDMEAKAMLLAKFPPGAYHEPPVLLDPVGEGGVFDPVLGGEAARALAAVPEGIQQTPALVGGEPQPPDLIRPDEGIHRCPISDTYHPASPRTY